MTTRDKALKYLQDKFVGQTFNYISERHLRNYEMNLNLKVTKVNWTGPHFITLTVHVSGTITTFPTDKGIVINVTNPNVSRVVVNEHIQKFLDLKIYHYLKYFNMNKDNVILSYTCRFLKPKIIKEMKLVPLVNEQVLDRFDMFKRFIRGKPFEIGDNTVIIRNTSWERKTSTLVLHYIDIEVYNTTAKTFEELRYIIPTLNSELKKFDKYFNMQNMKIQITNPIRFLVHKEKYPGSLKNSTT